MQPAAEQTHPPLPTTRIGHYILDSLIGEGAVAWVYRARLAPDAGAANDQLPDDHPEEVALKLLKPHATTLPNVLASFQFEARVLLRLNHPGILRVYATGVAAGTRMYTAMELIDGGGLDHYLLAKKRLPEAQAVELGRQTAMALDYLHELGYVHRDIKPANLMLTRAGRVILTDFGTVIRIRDGADYETGLYGTPAFLAPEQIDPNAAVDGRADIYALGMILYLMVAGRKPYYGGRSEVLVAQQQTIPPPPSDFVPVSPELESVILKALAKDPAARFQHGRDLASALDAADLLPAPVAGPSLIDRLFGWIRRG